MKIPIGVQHLFDATEDEELVLMIQYTALELYYNRGIEVSIEFPKYEDGDDDEEIDLDELL